MSAAKTQRGLAGRKCLNGLQQKKKGKEGGLPARSLVAERKGLNRWVVKGPITVKIATNRMSKTILIGGGFLRWGGNDISGPRVGIKKEGHQSRRRIKDQ